MKKNLIIVGIGSTANQMYFNFKDRTEYNVVGFSVDKKYIKENKHYELPIFPLEKLEEYYDLNDTDLFVAVGWNKLNRDRTFLYNRLKSKGVTFASYISPTAMLQSNISIGSNCWISDGAIIESFTKIGNNTFVKSGSWVAHNCNIGSNCWIGAKSIIAGKTVIKDFTFIGIGAIVFDCITIEENNIIGAGCIIKKSTSKNYLAYSLESCGKTYHTDKLTQKLTI